jgi:hypothetical protein
MANFDLAGTQYGRQMLEVRANSPQGLRLTIVRIE